jgi:hypothetical protein
MVKQGLPSSVRGSLFGASSKKKLRSKSFRNNPPVQPVISSSSNHSLASSSSSPRQREYTSATEEKQTQLWTEAIALIDERMSSTPSRKKKTVTPKNIPVTRSFFRKSPLWGKRSRTQETPMDKYFVRADSDVVGSSAWKRRQEKNKDRRRRDDSDDDSSTCSDDESTDSQESVELTFQSLMCDFKHCMRFESDEDSDDENLSKQKQVVKKNKKPDFLDDMMDRLCH